MTIEPENDPVLINFRGATHARTELGGESQSAVQAHASANPAPFHEDDLVFLHKRVHDRTRSAFFLSSSPLSNNGNKKLGT